ncbi:MAG: M16 family metallopeptidase [Candidatus Neomarinimicrobiota bacterium]
MIKNFRPILLSLTFLIISCNSKPSTTFTIDYEKYILDNGLEVILHKDNSDPIVGVAIQYHVGSNREVPGRTGFAHLFEHMLFQESQHVGQDQFFKIIQSAGGTLNGGTNKDGTVYYEVVPKNALEIVLWLESDRMGWLLPTVTQAAFTNQQEVVQNEKRQRVDNRPYGHNNYAVIKNLYPKDHPYNWTTIGELEDLKNATLKDVRDFYKRWYGPNNATLVIAGDINERQVKKLVQKYFGEIQQGPTVLDMEPQPITLETTKKVFHEDNFANSPRLRMVFPTVHQRHSDAPALELLGQLLGDGKKAPLYTVIVEENKLAPSVVSYNSPLEIAGTFNITVTAFPTTNLTDLEKSVFAAFKKFEINGFTEDDLDRLKAKYETGFYQGISSVLGKGFRLAYYNEYYGSPDAISKDLESVLAVSIDDVKRVFDKYIKDENYVLTSFVPKGKTDLVADGSELFAIKEEKIVENVEKLVGTSEEELEKISSSFDRSIKPAQGPDPNLNIPVVWRHDYPSKLFLFGANHDELPLINFGIRIRGGMLLDSPEKIGVANLISDMLIEGTATKSPIELEEAIDALGSSISIYTTKESINIEVTCLKRNFEATLALAEEILFEPRWDEKEFARIKAETIEGINRSSAIPSTIASNVFNRLNYGNHILANSTMGTEESVMTIELEDLKKYYEDNFSVDLSTISIVGDINQNGAIKAFKSLSDRWEIKDVNFPEYAMPEPNNKAKIYFVDVPGAKQSEIRIGYLSMQYTDPDYIPATVMNMKLGGNFSSDINLTLREEKGFTYGARSRFTGSRFPGLFIASSAVRSNTTEESVQIFKDIMTRYREPISEEDLEFTKNMIIKSNSRRFETLGALRGMIANISTYNLPFDYIKDRENMVRDFTIEEHNGLAKEYVRPSEMIYLIVGDAATQYEGLKSLGYGDPIMLNNNGNPVD